MRGWGENLLYSSAVIAIDIVARWSGLLALTGLAGAFAFSPLFLASPALARARERARRASRRARLAALVFAAGAFAVDALSRLDDAAPPSLLPLAARAVGLASLFGLWLLRRDESWAAVVSASGLLFTQSAMSRSAATGELAPVLADWAHLIFTAIWLGGVAQLALVHAPAATGPDGRADLGRLIDRFSPWAMFCVLGLAVTGLAQSAAFVGSVEALWTTDYGRALSAKLALFAALVGFGAFHQQVIAPVLRRWRAASAIADRETGTAARRFRAGVLAELAVSAATLLAAAAMVALPLR